MLRKLELFYSTRFHGMRMGEDWEEYFAPSKRETRKERKRAVQRDRSKYKKTDQRKVAEKIDTPSNCIHGKVITIRSKDIIVYANDHMYTCTVRGVLKLERTKDKNLIVVGDNVWMRPVDQTTGVIFAVKSRTSILCRQEHLHRKKQQLVAANVDQVLITLSLAEPASRSTIIDRYLVAAYKGNFDPVIVFNKMDLREQYPQEELRVEEYLALYTSLNIPTIAVSAVTGEGLKELEYVLKSKVSVFSGQSGTGKTHLINAITGFELKTGEVRAIGKGAHTTTFAQLLALPFEGWCVDTPGIRSFGIWDLKKQDLIPAFPEIFSQGCSFANCWHQGEEGCSIPQAIEEGRVSPFRYASYLSLLESATESKY